MKEKEFVWSDRQGRVLVAMLSVALFVGSFKPLIASALGV